MAAYKKGMVMRMKQKKCRGLLLLLLGSLMLSGCGLQETPYKLTEEEQQLIVSYSAHVVSKFNRYQKDGLTYVPEGEQAEEEILAEPETEQAKAETEDEGSAASGTGTGQEIEKPAEEAVLDTVFAEMGLTFTYLGNEVAATYMEDDTYAVNARYGKNLFVLKMKVENLTEEAITVDNLSSGDVFSVEYVMESGETYRAKSVMTLLLNDFTTYEGSIEPNEAVEMVIVFEIPAGTTVIEHFSLEVERNGNNFQINL